MPAAKAPKEPRIERKWLDEGKKREPIAEAKKPTNAKS